MCSTAETRISAVGHNKMSLTFFGSAAHSRSSWKFCPMLQSIKDQQHECKYIRTHICKFIIYIYIYYTHIITYNYIYIYKPSLSPAAPQILRYRICCRTNSASTLASQATFFCRRGCHQMPAVSTQQSHPAKIRAARLKRKSFPLLRYSLVPAFHCCSNCFSSLPILFTSGTDVWKCT